MSFLFGNDCRGAAQMKPGEMSTVVGDSGQYTNEGRTGGYYPSNQQQQQQQPSYDYENDFGEERWN